MEDDDLMSATSVVRRIMWTGTWWFIAAVMAAAIFLGLLLTSGWRPALLSGGEAVLWWVGAVVTGLSIGLLGWSGCPILEVDVPTAAKNKSRTMQLGTLLFILGSLGCALAVLLGPATG